MTRIRDFCLLLVICFCITEARIEDAPPIDDISDNDGATTLSAWSRWQRLLKSIRCSSHPCDRNDQGTTRFRSHHLRGKEPSNSEKHHRRNLNFMSFFETNQPQEQDNIFALRAEVAALEDCTSGSACNGGCQESFTCTSFKGICTCLPFETADCIGSSERQCGGECLRDGEECMEASEVGSCECVPVLVDAPTESPAPSMSMSSMVPSVLDTFADGTSFPTSDESNMPSPSMDLTMFPSEGSPSTAVPSVSPWPSEGSSQSIEPSPVLASNMPTESTDLTMFPSERPSEGSPSTAVPSVSPWPTEGRSQSMEPSPVFASNMPSDVTDLTMFPSEGPSEGSPSTAVPSVSPWPTEGPSSPTASPAPSAFPTTSSLPPFTDERAVASGTYGDPHIITWDNLEFDCQAAGEFTMVKALSDSVNFEVQERFTAVSNACSAAASVSTGFVVQADGIPNVQVSIPRNDPNPTLILNDCPIDFRSNGELLDSSLLTPSLDAFGAIITLNPGASQVVVEYPSGLALIATIRNSQEFGCFFLMQMVLPPVYFVETLVGLLGTPNRNDGDEWTDASGNVIAIPENERDLLFRAAYEYCTTNWCIDNESESLFVYTDDESFDGISGCDEPYNDAIERKIQELDDEGPLATICCNEFPNDCDFPCLIDGVCGDESDAANALEDQDAIFGLKALLDQDSDSTPEPSVSPNFRPSEADPTCPPSTPNREPGGNQPNNRDRRRYNNRSSWYKSLQKSWDRHKREQQKKQQKMLKKILKKYKIPWWKQNNNWGHRRFWW